MQSEAALREGAVACFANAQELYEEAKLLFVQAQSPRAVVLALIGQEEFAKAVVYTVAALLPEQRHRLPPKLGGHELRRFLKKNFLIQDVGAGLIKMSYLGNAGWRFNRFSTACIAAFPSEIPFW